MKLTNGSSCSEPSLRAIAVFLLVALRGFAASGFSPEESIKHMRVPDGFEVKLFASEPEIRQPVAMYFDERGRMWVIQYLQYPSPAGLKAVEVDQFLRTKYDKVPEPPPKGPVGADRVTICEDTDGDGKADKFTDFVSGLNMTTGVAVGHGGVFILQTPYLLFYPDKNHDDIPDGKPEVLLKGFGMEDSHAYANSLQWGPDGWLYGAHGSTVTAKINGIEFQQGIWRYHPVTHQFELFAEGGGNTWGVDFDENGNIIAGTNFGEQIGLHQVQGGYYVKGFAKHGPLHNAYTFGFFDHIPYRGFKGGHVTCGGIVYSGGLFPESFNGTYIAGNLLANSVYWHRLTHDGSSFKGQFGGELLGTEDTWFRPVDCAIGPDGAVYVADWCDKRATHLDSKESWDKSNGRIYKVQPVGAKSAAPFNLRRLTGAELVSMLSNTNEWYARESRRLLAERHDEKLLPALEKQIFEQPNPHVQLESHWALYVSGGFDGSMVQRLLEHPNENVRTWTIRFIGDSGAATPVTFEKLSTLAAQDPSPAVRNQLACSMKRLTGGGAIGVLEKLLWRSEDISDPQIPLLIWWALESKAVSQKAAVLKLFETPAFWEQPMVAKYIVERIARRYVADAKKTDFAACAQLFTLAPGPQSYAPLIRGISDGLAGQSLKTVPESLNPWIKKLWDAGIRDSQFLELSVRLGSKTYLEEATKMVADDSTAEAKRIALIDAIGQASHSTSLQPMISLLTTARSAKIRLAALGAVQRYADPSIGGVLLNCLADAKGNIRTAIIGVLASRVTWASELARAVDMGKIDAKEVGQEQLRKMAAFKNSDLTALIQKRWGRVNLGATSINSNLVNELKLLLSPSGTTGRSKEGDVAEGKKVFTTNCAVCHKLFGEGNTTGPDLTGSDRKNADFLLVNIVSPSAFIRPEYISYEITTSDDQSFTGLIAESTPSSVTILDANNQKTVIATQKIKEQRESSVSLMPEGLLSALSQKQIIDLFTYLQSDPPR